MQPADIIQTSCEMKKMPLNKGIERHVQTLRHFYRHCGHHLIYIAIFITSNKELIRIILCSRRPQHFPGVFPKCFLSRRPLPPFKCLNVCKASEKQNQSIIEAIVVMSAIKDIKHRPTISGEDRASVFPEGEFKVFKRDLCQHVSFVNRHIQKESW